MENAKIIAVYEKLLAQNPAYRKQIGAFYTPAFIVNYMVEVCFSNAFKNKTYAETCQITAIDPSCGGGAFLVGAYEYLLVYHSHKREKVLSLDERKAILFAQIFGVDIDAEAVKVCKQALLLVCFQKTTLDEIDIALLQYNIKCGNSLISRFAIDADMKQALKRSKWTMDTYKIAVATYRNAENKEQKREMERLIAAIKSDFRSEISKNDPKKIKENRLEGELFNAVNQQQFFELSKKEKAEQDKKIKQLAQEIETLAAEIEGIQQNKIFDNAFEWRFEFPEVLNNEGDFVGFDVVIGNPPYIDYREIEKLQTDFLKNYKASENSFRPNLYHFFIELGYSIMRERAIFCYINPNQFLSIDAGFGIRKFIVENTIIQFIDDLSNIKVFNEAATYTVVWSFTKEKNGNYPVRISKCFEVKDIGKEMLTVRKNDIIANGKYLIIANVNQVMVQKIEKDKHKLGALCNMIWGTSQSGYGDKKIKHDVYDILPKNESANFERVIQTRDIKRYSIDWKEEYIPIDIFSSNAIQKFQLAEKIVIARMTLRLQATIDTHQFFVGKSTILFDLDNKLTYHFLLGILNSKLINFWYKNYFENTHLSGGYIRFDIPYLKKIPIVVPALKDQENIANLVKNILDKKQHSADTTALEWQIDKLVYALYDLTEEEIKIVEKA